jgi:hypothetical protein
VTFDCLDHLDNKMPTRVKIHIPKTNKNQVETSDSLGVAEDPSIAVDVKNDLSNPENKMEVLTQDSLGVAADPSNVINVSNDVSNLESNSCQLGGRDSLGKNSEILDVIVVAKNDLRLEDHQSLVSSLMGLSSKSRTKISTKSSVFNVSDCSQEMNNNDLVISDKSSVEV